jgi:hypothetical protein
MVIHTRAGDIVLMPARGEDSLLIRGDDSKKCFQVAEKELGSNGMVLRCGHLVGSAWIGTLQMAPATLESILSMIYTGFPTIA